MASASYRFGPFLVDGVAYRLWRGRDALDLTPQLLDLLVYLLEHAGTLVTKDTLLTALWPDANVTDHALFQAVSELRRAIGDDAHAPRYIKTIARRGYRFIATVAREGLSGPPDPVPLHVPAIAAPDPRTVAVLDFENISGDAECAWLATGIADAVTSDLRALAHFQVVDRSRVADVIGRPGDAPEDVAAALQARLLVLGAFQRTNGRIRITARLVDAPAGETLAEAKVDGPLTDLFALQDHLVEHFSHALGLAPARAVARLAIRETSSLEASRAWTEGWLKIETLDTRALPGAIADFSRAVAADARYALAYAGLATAQFAVYESSRFDAKSHDTLLTDAIAHARRAVELDEGLAEAHATLAMVLVSAWQTPEAAASARRAVALEPSQWRHLFRLCHATWGDARLDAAAGTLALYPGLAFAHFQMAMVYVGRGQLAQADTVLRMGVEVQDRQIRQHERFPALGLHWLRGLVRLAQDDVADALTEFDRELQVIDLHRLYGREYAMEAWQGRGLALLRAGRPGDATEAFARALELYPQSVPSHLGLSRALRALGHNTDADRAFLEADRALETLTHLRPIEAGIARAQRLSAQGQLREAVKFLERLLADAPPGFAAWVLPVDPLLRPLHGTSEFATVLQRLADRAR
jgi:DNA-binding winged helix-turn-helix (wHTH) protein/tetratricopeptide (TPR) repeat protein